MLQFLSENWGNLLAGAILLAVIVLVVFYLYRNKKKGKSSCGCGCSSCPAAGRCHKN